MTLHACNLFLDWVYKYSVNIGLAFGLLAILVWYMQCNKSIGGFDGKHVGALFAVGLSGYSIPQALLLIICAFDPDRLKTFEGYRIYLVLSALTVIGIGVASVRKQIAEMNSEDADRSLAAAAAAASLAKGNIATPGGTSSASP